MDPSPAMAPVFAAVVHRRTGGRDDGTHNPLKLEGAGWAGYTGRAHHAGAGSSADTASFSTLDDGCRAAALVMQFRDCQNVQVAFRTGDPLQFAAAIESSPLASMIELAGLVSAVEALGRGRGAALRRRMSALTSTVRSRQKRCTALGGGQPDARRTWTEPLATPTLVSVIVPTCDRPEMLAEALASIRAIEGPDIRFQIIVADNGHSRPAGDVAARFDATYAAVQTRGAAAARNVGLRLAAGDFIAFLDDDDLWLMSHVRPHLLMLAEHPEFDAAIGQAVNTDITGRELGQPWPTRIRSDGRVATQFFSFHPQIGTTIVRASVAKRVGEFDERLKGDQDWDWQLRLAAIARIGFVPRPSVLFRQRPIGTDTHLMWTRLPYLSTVMWRNALRMPGNVRLSTITAFIAHRGTYSFYFGQAARAHYSAGDVALARTAMRYSFLSSPPHFAMSVLRDKSIRLLLVPVLTGKS